MRRLSPSIVILATIISCSKTSDTLPPPRQPEILRTGWTKYQLPENSDIFDIAFSTLERGFIAVHQKGIYQSIDSGKTWNAIPSTAGKDILTIRFLNSQYGFFIGYDTYGYTEDGGNTWNFKNPPPGGGYDIQFLTPSLGYISGPNGVFKTIDTGNTWSLVKTGNFSGLHFLDEQNGWASTIGGAAQMFFTNDGGASWNLKYESLYDNFHAVQFYNLNTGWAISNRKMVKTTNGGDTWQNIETGQNTSDIEFLNSELGYRSQWGEIKKTADGGKIWATQVSLSGVMIYELVFLDTDHGWASGSNGTILRYSKP